MLSFLFLLIAAHQVQSSSATFTYIYLSDKLIDEEIPIGTHLVNLSAEFTHYQNKSFNTDSNNNDDYLRFSLLDDSAFNSRSSLIELSPDQGILTSRVVFDRESMCMSKQCDNICHPNPMAAVAAAAPSLNDSLLLCRLSLKVLVLPTYNILAFNLAIRDLNDNRPRFKAATCLLTVNENVPVGHRIPLPPATDPDQIDPALIHYQLVSGNSPDEFFALFFDPVDAKLYLAVLAGLDYERTASYRMQVRASDDSGDFSDAAVLDLILQVNDLNDHSPIFNQTSYEFESREDCALDTVLGRVLAVDLDSGLNGLVRYRLVEFEPTMMVISDDSVRRSEPRQKLVTAQRYFEINETTGLLRVKAPLDYEAESSFRLCVEARDSSGDGNMPPAYAAIHVRVIDVNDNAPEITVSFMSGIQKNFSQLEGFEYDTYIREHTRSHFIAHVNIFDRDAGTNGVFSWKVLLNQNQLVASSGRADLPQKETSNSEVSTLFNVIKLNDNSSFTLNIGSSSALDRELNDHFNVTIVAHDFLGVPVLARSFYNFTIRLLDINDNRPQFASSVFNITVRENNNDLTQSLLRVLATDADSDSSSNANVSYAIREHSDLFSIDANGDIRSRVSLDRESVDQYKFHVIAFDNGFPRLSSSALVHLTVLDRNDNFPIVKLETVYRHEFRESEQLLEVELGRELTANTKIVFFEAVDLDAGENGQVEFLLVANDEMAKHVFKLNSARGELSLRKKLSEPSLRFTQQIELSVVCRDMGNLNTTIRVRVRLAKGFGSALCIEQKRNSSRNNVKYVNRELASAEQERLFEAEFELAHRLSGLMQKRTHRLKFELLNHADLFALSWKVAADNDLHQIQLRLVDRSKISVGKYLVKLKVASETWQTCARRELFTLLVGNSRINATQIGAILNLIRLNSSSMSAKQVKSLKQKLDHVLLASVNGPTRWDSGSALTSKTTVSSKDVTSLSLRNKAFYSVLLIIFLTLTLFFSFVFAIVIFHNFSGTKKSVVIEI